MALYLQTRFIPDARVRRICKLQMSIGSSGKGSCHQPGHCIIAASPGIWKVQCETAVYTISRLVWERPQRTDCHRHRHAENLAGSPPPPPPVQASPQAIYPGMEHARNGQNWLQGYVLGKSWSARQVGPPDKPTSESLDKPICWSAGRADGAVVRLTSIVSRPGPSCHLGPPFCLPTPSSCCPRGVAQVRSATLHEGRRLW